MDAKTENEATMNELNELSSSDLWNYWDDAIFIFVKGMCQVEFKQYWNKMSAVNVRTSTPTPHKRNTQRLHWIDIFSP